MTRQRAPEAGVTLSGTTRSLAGKLESHSARGWERIVKQGRQLEVRGNGSVALA